MLIQQLTSAVDAAEPRLEGPGVVDAGSLPPGDSAARSQLRDQDHGLMGRECEA